MNRYTQRPLYYIKLLEPSIDFEKGKLIPIYKRVVEVGRGPGNRIQYGNERTNVSRNHCHLTYQDGKVSLVTMHKNDNVTFVNQKEVSNDISLIHGDVVTLALKGPRIKLVVESKLSSKIEFGKIKAIDVGIGALILMLFYQIFLKLNSI